jgi:hypothetical protein
MNYATIIPQNVVEINTQFAGFPLQPACSIPPPGARCRSLEHPGSNNMAQHANLLGLCVAIHRGAVAEGDAVMIEVAPDLVGHHKCRVTALWTITQSCCPQSPRRAQKVVRLPPNSREGVPAFLTGPTVNGRGAASAGACSQLRAVVVCKYSGSD